MASSLWGNVRLNVPDLWTEQRNLLGGTKLYGEGVGVKQCLNNCCERVVARSKGTREQTFAKETAGFVGILASLSRAVHLITHVWLIKRLAGCTQTEEEYLP